MNEKQHAQDESYRSGDYPPVRPREADGRVERLRKTGQSLAPLVAIQELKNLPHIAVALTAIGQLLYEAADALALPAAPTLTNAERSQRFNDTTGSSRGGNQHPDRCVCQEKETGSFADTRSVSPAGLR